MFWNRRMFWNVRPMPRGDDVVGPGAANDADPREPVLVPRRARDGDHEHHHHNGQGDGQGDEDARLAGPGTKEQPDDDGKRGRDQPRHALEPDSARPCDQYSAPERDRSSRGVDDPGDHVEERRLAGPIRPDDADDPAGRDDKVNVSDSHQASEAT